MISLAFLSYLTTGFTTVSIGVDVGTGSARAGVVDVSTGALLAVKKQNIKTWSPIAEHHQQSSEDIWDACAACVRGALAEAGNDLKVAGVGFDATCSLVCLDEKNAPVGTDPTEPDDDARNIILWMDHRATPQADAINAMGHERLSTVGGTISPEMEIPKISWLREKMPGAFSRVNKGGKFLDLADFLAYRATDYKRDVRSLCTVVCKWAYDANADGTGLGWDRSFLSEVGFGEAELLPSVIGSDVQAPGVQIEGGLGESAASSFGLPVGTPIAVGMIDAHAGGIGCLGATLPTPSSEQPPLTARIALIAGTSTCHMASSSAPTFVPGVWGPYYSAMLPNLYLNEGGQSAAGALIDFVIESHAAYEELKGLADAENVPPTIYLNKRLEEMAAEAGEANVATLASQVHVTPDFIGNRSPLADPLMKGGIVGLPMSSRLDDLARVYLATVQALAYQTKAIIEALGYTDPPISSVVACGGLAKNPLYVSTHADVLGLEIHTPVQEEAVLLGAAILGAAAGGAHDSVEEAMGKMSAIGDTCAPEGGEAVAAFHEKKYNVFRKMSDDQREYRRMMA